MKWEFTACLPTKQQRTHRARDHCLVPIFSQLNLSFESNLYKQIEHVSIFVPINSSPKVKKKTYIKMQTKKK